MREPPPVFVIGRSGKSSKLRAPQSKQQKCHPNLHGPAPQAARLGLDSVTEGTTPDQKGLPDYLNPTTSKQRSSQHLNPVSPQGPKLFLSPTSFIRLACNDVLTKHF